MKIGAIIQARTSSKRFPKKVLKSLPYGSEISVLQQDIRRVKQSSLLDEVIIATTTNPDDDEIVEVAIKEETNYFRGSLDNVLERYYQSALKFNLDVIVRITSDCPCVDWNVIDDIIQSHIDSDADYTSNTLIETFPRGIDCEVLNFNVLKEAYENASEKYEKEHVTPYIYKTNPEKFKINKYTSPENYSDIRITLDTPQDYALLCVIYDNLYENNHFFTLDDILDLFERKPWIKYINEDIIQKKVFNSLSEELTEAIYLCERQDLDKAKEFIKNHFGE
ncbi:cytidylyltransferase domain-containing protein [Methanobrevibacter sp.]|uniref:cytidylyltransferase domain-containing protein n=1 Tax=Methanobrevibacter sp. TaxID=66852 RepID=UPI00388EBA07